MLGILNLLNTVTVRLAAETLCPLGTHSLCPLDTEDLAPPPPEPPPLLSDEQLIFLSNHGHLQFRLSPSLLILYEHLAAARAAVFEQSSQIKNHDYPATDLTETGYVHVEGGKEYISFRFAMRSGSDSLELLAQRVWQETCALLHRALVDIARGMGLAYEAWDRIISGCLSMPPIREETTSTLLRTFRYVANSDTAEAHSNLELLTLCVGFGKGLQVLFHDRKIFTSAQWIDVKGPTLLIDQVLRTLSEKRLRAGLHRVTVNSADRQSIVFALRPSLRHDHIDLTLYGDEGSLSMSKLWAEIRGSRFNVNAQKNIRVEQKEHMRLKKEQGNELDSVSTDSFFDGNTG